MSYNHHVNEISIVVSDGWKVTDFNNNTVYGIKVDKMLGDNDNPSLIILKRNPNPVSSSSVSCNTPTITNEKDIIPVKLGIYTWSGKIYPECSFIDSAAGLDSSTCDVIQGKNVLLYILM